MEENLDLARALERARQNGIYSKTIFDRLRYGWSVKRAVTEPTRAKRPPMSKFLRAVAHANGIATHTVYMRLRLGWPLEAALSFPRHVRPFPPPAEFANSFLTHGLRGWRTARSASEALVQAELRSREEPCVGVYRRTETSLEPFLIRGTSNLFVRGEILAWG